MPQRHRSVPPNLTAIRLLIAIVRSFVECVAESDGSTSGGTLLMGLMVGALAPYVSISLRPPPPYSPPNNNHHNNSNVVQIPYTPTQTFRHLSRISLSVHSHSTTHAHSTQLRTPRRALSHSPISCLCVCTSALGLAHSHHNTHITKTTSVDARASCFLVYK